LSTVLSYAKKKPVLLRLRLREIADIGDIFLKIKGRRWAVEP
jgi:hypothetical protein